MSDILLKEPLLIPPGQREFSGSFRLAPDFKLGLRTGVDGWTSYGAIGGARLKNTRVVDVELDASALDFASNDWRVSMTNGLHIDDSSGVLVEHFRAKRIPQDAILVKRSLGVEIVDVEAEECSGLLSIVHQANQDDPGSYRFKPRVCRDFLVKDWTFRNGRNPLPPGNPYYSLLRPGESFGGDAVKATGLQDSEITDGQTVGETFIATKLAACSNVQLRRIVGAGITVQGCWQWSASGPVTPPLWPAHAPIVGEDVLLEDCILSPSLTLCRFGPDPSRGLTSAQVHLNYPQLRTKLRGGHLWHEAGWPVCVGAFEGVDLDLRGVTFHQVTGPLDPNTLLVSDSLPEIARSTVNDDWRTVNRYSVE